MVQALEGRLTKRAHSKICYTKKQVDELKKCMDSVTGPDYFMTHFYYIQARNGNELYKPYKFQNRLTDAFHNYRYSIALISRQCGKCVRKATLIKIRNKKTRKIQKITMEKFYKMIN